MILFATVQIILLLFAIAWWVDRCEDEKQKEAMTKKQQEKEKSAYDTTQMIIDNLIKESKTDENQTDQQTFRDIAKKCTYRNKPGSSIDFN